MKTKPSEFNEQQVFNKTARHLLRQGKRAVVQRPEGTACVYLASDGSRCAVGCWIKPTSPIIHIQGPSDFLLRHVTLCRPGSRLRQLLETHTDLLRDLQCVHDGVQPSQWRRRLEVIARERGLTMPTITEDNTGGGQ